MDKKKKKEDKTDYRTKVTWMETRYEVKQLTTLLVTDRDIRHSERLDGGYEKGPDHTKVNWEYPE